MKKLFVFTLIVSVFILFFSLNPDSTKHKEKVLEEVKPLISEYLETESKLVSLFLGNYISSEIERTISNQVSVDNYFLFSLTKANIKGDKEEIIGVGVLNKVFLFFDKDDTRKKIDDYLLKSTNKKRSNKIDVS